ncbi:MAG: hypothetical protein AAF208_14455 [Cyanobacteria bacterium P01_A01_bin.45]
MERGLLWLPLLVAFFWLARQGAREFQKVEAYKTWAEQFERAKYDIYAVIGQKDDTVTWGKPTPKGPINLETFSLNNISQVNLLVNGKEVTTNQLPRKGRKIELEFIFSENNKSELNHSIKIPFTEIPLAAKWGKFFQDTLTNQNQQNI